MRSKPGGYLLFTTHGRSYANALLSGQAAKDLRLPRLVVLNPLSAGVSKTYGECNAFHPEPYVKGLVQSQGFTVIDFGPGETVDAARRLIGQDMWLLRRPS